MWKKKILVTSFSQNVFWFPERNYKFTVRPCPFLSSSNDFNLDHSKSLLFGKRLKHVLPVKPSCCFQISCLEGDGTGLLPIKRGLKAIGVLNTSFPSGLLSFSRLMDLVIRLVGVHGLLKDSCGVLLTDLRGKDSSFFTLSPVVGVLFERKTFCFGVEGVFGVVGVWK